MQEDFAQILENKLRCNIHSIQKRRKAILLKTSRGPIFLKGYDSPEKAEWTVNLTKQLNHKGFRQTIGYIYTTDGLPYIPFRRKYYLLMDFISGRNAEYRRLEDLMYTTACLGKFHRYARHITGGPEFNDRTAPIIEKWENRLERFTKVVDGINRSRHAGDLETLDYRLYSLSPFIISEAKITLNLTKNSSLANEYTRAIENRHVAHRDLASHNFLIGNKIYLIDYDTASYDTQLVDLVQMVHRSMDEQKWDINVFLRMMQQYERFVPLTREQQALSVLLLRYPDNIMREVNALYEQRNRQLSPYASNYIAMILSQWSKRAEFFSAGQHFFLASHL